MLENRVIAQIWPWFEPFAELLSMEQNFAKNLTLESLVFKIRSLETLQQIHGI